MRIVGDENTLYWCKKHLISGWEGRRERERELSLQNYISDSSISDISISGISISGISISDISISGISISGISISGISISDISEWYY